MSIVYLAHQVSAPTKTGIKNNLRVARHWLRFLVDHTDHAISAPWMPYVETLAESAYRERGLRDDMAMLERHDAIVLCGSRISSGMLAEMDHALSHGIPVVDLTPYHVDGFPPTRAHTLLFSSIHHEVMSRIGGWTYQ